jgi:uncharacterized protein (TIGR02996 family)
MPPPGYEPFLRAICADPEDDTVRLVYADWLDENGDPERAEFIRCQIACPDWPGFPDPRFMRAKELRTLRGGTWLAELPKLKGADWGAFRRGFVSKATFADARHFQLGCGPALRAAPIQTIYLRSVNPEVFQWFLTTPFVSRIREFGAGSYVNDRCIEALATDPRSGTLEAVALTGGGQITGWGGPTDALSDVSALALARSPHLVRLGHVVLCATTITEAGCAELQTRFGEGVTIYPRRSTPPPDTPPQ